MREAEIDNLGKELFKAFAQFEYELKATGFHNGDGRAKVNWHKFEKFIEPHFKDSKEKPLAEAVNYILAKPPRKQMIKGGELEWEDYCHTGKTQSALVLTYVRQVRNNLFHGGKFGNRWLAPEGSSELLKHPLTLVKAYRAKLARHRMIRNSEARRAAGY